MTDNPSGGKAAEEFARDAVALAEGFSQVCAHVPPGDAGGPVAQLSEVIREGDCAFDDDVSVGGSFVIYAEGNKGGMSDIIGFDAGVPGGENEGISVQSKPDGGDMRPRILSYRSQFASTRPRYQKRQRFFMG